jgi:hypothetical protein
LESRQLLSGGTITVNTTLDVIDPPGSSRVSLRDAISAVNAGEDTTIDLPAGTYKITIPGAGEFANASGSFDLLPSTDVTIQGIGTGQSVINANGLDRAFAIMPSASCTVTLQNLKITGGSAPIGSGSAGGGIDVIDTSTAVGNLALVDTTVVGNTAPNGGGIATVYGAVTLTRSKVNSNSASGDGGGIYTINGNVSLASSTVNSNTSGCFSRASIRVTISERRSSSVGALELGLGLLARLGAHEDGEVIPLAVQKW